MKVAVLWKVWNDYLEASLDELARHGHQVLLCETTPRGLLDDELSRYAPVVRCRLSGDSGAAGVADELERFGPDIMLICSWDVAAYRSIARSWRHRAVRLVYMDNQWLSTPRQWLGVITAPLRLWPSYDGAFVTGGRQAAFAKRLGFAGPRHQKGSITADTRKFAGTPKRQGFIFVGRLVDVKALDVLAAGYLAYRSAVEAPWELSVCGAGPMASHVQGLPGVHMVGFVHPSRLPDTLGAASCLVLPSRFEQYGVVVHEATSMGLHVIASEAVGAADDFVRDGVNGRVVRTDDAAALADAMLWMHQRTAAQLVEGQLVSQQLAALRSPATWVRDLLFLADRFDTQRGLLRAAVRRG